MRWITGLDLIVHRALAVSGIDYKSFMEVAMGGTMPSFEEGFSASESAANSMLNALNEATRVARQLRKASQDGNIAAIRRLSERLETSASAIGQAASNAAVAWPFPEEEERPYLEREYSTELRSEGKKHGVQIFERDGRLIAHPLVVRVLPGDRAVRIDRRQTSAIRPSKIVADLERLQKSPARFRPQSFLESLYEAYLALAQANTADRLKLGCVGQVVRLDRIYNLFTGLPGSKREYSLLDFARDLYTLQESGVREVRSGARVSFPASSGTRSARGAISFVGPSGDPVLFYGIQFSGVNS